MALNGKRRCRQFDRALAVVERGNNKTINRLKRTDGGKKPSRLSPFWQK
jgi:hypothetical protein